MRFKQNWSILRQMRLGLCVISAILIPYCVYLLCRQEWIFALVLLFIELFLAGCFCFTARAIPGVRTNEIEMDARGITLHQDGKADLFFPWDEIASVRKSRRYGTNTLVVTNRTGKEIWFFTSRRIEAYMMNHMEKTPAAFYFYDTDETGTAEYDLSGDAYRELLDVCGKYCAIVSFLTKHTARNGKQSKRTAFRSPITYLLCIGDITRWTMKHRSLNASVCATRCSASSPTMPTAFSIGNAASRILLSSAGTERHFLPVSRMKANAF